MRLLRISAICRKHGRLISLLSALVVCSLVGIFTFMSIVANAVIVRASAACVSIALSVNPHQGNDGLPSLDIRFEPSGTHVDNHGNLKIRLDFYPGPEDKSYAQQHVEVVDTNSPEFLAGYKGPLNKDGTPKNQADYDAWYASLPKVWVTNPALSHFLTVKPDITLAELDALVKSMFPGGVTATIDDASTQANSAHLLSPYMRDKSVTTTEKVATGQDKDSLVAAVNARLAGYEVTDSSGGQIEPIQPQSIDLGSTASDRSTRQGANYTRITANNPANATGTLDTWELWFDAAVADGANVEVATFYIVSADHFSTRDSETIGTVTKGSKQTFSGLSTDVSTGDYSGYYCTAGYLEVTATGGLTSWRSQTAVDNIPCTNTTFDAFAPPTYQQVWSLYATGTESATVAISVSPTSYDFGTVSVGSTTNTTGNYFAITNTSGVTTNATIQMLAANWTASASGWTHSDSAAGANTAAMKASTDNGTTWSSSVFVKYNSAYETLWTNLGANANVVFGLSLLAPTSLVNGNSNNNTVRITAFAAS